MAHQNNYLHISTCRKTSLLLINSIHVVLSSLEIQRLIKDSENQRDKIYYKVFNSVWKEETHKLSKEVTAKTFFSNVYVTVHNLLRWTFFIPCNNWKTVSLVKDFCGPEISSTITFLLSLKQVIWKKFTF